MKTSLLTFAALAGSLAMLSACDNANNQSYDTYTCDQLTSLDEQYAGSVIYYTKGHYDAKNHVWTDYGPKGKSVTVDEVDDYYLPVEDIYDYCKQNPKETLSHAIHLHQK